MASQNILQYYGSILDIKVDYSELYDYQISKVQGDYNTDVLNFSTPIDYTSLKIDTTLIDNSCFFNRINLIEYDDSLESGDNPNYIYSGLTMNLGYLGFTTHLSNITNTSYSDVLLNNDVYTYTGITNEIHYFVIEGFNLTNPTDDRLSWFSEIDLISGFTPTIFQCSTDIFHDINRPYLSQSNTQPWTDDDYFSGNSHYPKSNWFYGQDSFAQVSGWTLTGITPQFPIQSFTPTVWKPGFCCPQPDSKNVKPWAYRFDTGIGDDFCKPILQRRTNKGWTLDFVFNRETQPWSHGSTFYYFGVRGDDDITKYADNNLSFQFTPSGQIRWVAVRYSGDCSPTGYTDGYYVDTDVTSTLCTTDQHLDFNVTIVFERYRNLEECDVSNDGGWNDLITGKTITNNPISVLSGSTEQFDLIEQLGVKWSNSKPNRLGKLKIYVNGNPIYTRNNWEEIVPSTRGVQPFIQSWGGGTGLMGGVHDGTCCFNMKSIKYFEEPLDYVHVHHHYLTVIKPNFDIKECGEGVRENLVGFFETELKSEEGITLITEDGNIIVS